MSEHSESVMVSLKMLPFIISLSSNFCALAVQLFHDIDFALAAVPVFKTIFMRSSEGLVPELVECAAGHWGKTLQSIMSGHG